MIFYLLLCNILFIPLIYSSNVTVSKPKAANNTESHKVNLPNETKVTLISEGGSLLPETSILALPKEKHTILMNLDSELGKNKVKPVVARKGVIYTEENNVKPPQNILSTSNKNSTDGPKPEGADISVKHNNSTNKLIISEANGTLPEKISTGQKDVNKTEVHKPLLLSYDVLANMTVKSSPETLVNNQIQSPNKDMKVYAKKANNHPGMIMPLVITILLVPMFAVLGYMALRRGQEAWKNRHYKRMDFLLDGMYND